MLACLLANYVSFIDFCLRFLLRQAFTPPTSPLLPMDSACLPTNLEHIMKPSLCFLRLSNNNVSRLPDPHTCNWVFFFFFCFSFVPKRHLFVVLIVIITIFLYKNGFILIKYLLSIEGKEFPFSTATGIGCNFRLGKRVFSTPSMPFKLTQMSCLLIRRY